MNEKATFLKLEKDQWIEVNFADIKKNDILAKLDLKDAYMVCVEEKHFDEFINDNCITVDYGAKPETEFDWSL